MVDFHYKEVLFCKMKKIFIFEISIYEPNIAIDEAMFDSLSPILDPMDK